MSQRTSREASLALELQAVEAELVALKEQLRHVSLELDMLLTAAWLREQEGDA